jgi:hypothetical protein
VRVRVRVRVELGEALVEVPHRSEKKEGALRLVWKTDEVGWR